MQLPTLAAIRRMLAESLRHDLGLKSFSLLAAVVIWAAVRMQTDPMTERRFSLHVHTTPAQEGMQVVKIDPPELAVTLRGRKSLLTDSAPEPARLEADISQATVGSQMVSVDVKRLRPGVQLVEMAHHRVQVEIDTVITEARAVQAQLRGRPADGFAAKGWQVQPNEVKITGPASSVKRVEGVFAVVDVSAAWAPVKRDVVAQARDANNFPVSDVVIEPARVTVTVSVEMVNTKTVPIRPVIGTPPSGWRLDTVSALPTSVTLSGSGQALAAIDSVNTARIDISDLRGTSAYSVPLDVPSGVQAVGAASARVAVTVVRIGTARGAGTAATGGSEEAPAEGAGGLQTDDQSDAGSDGHGGIERKPEGQDDGPDATPPDPQPGAGSAGSGGGTPATDPEKPADGGTGGGSPRTSPPGGSGARGTR